MGLQDFGTEPSGCHWGWVRDGLLFTNASGAICVSDGTGMNEVSNGTPTTNHLEGLTVVHEEGRTFTPLAVDLAEYSISVGAPEPIVFMGEKPDGETVEFTVTLDGVRDGPGGAVDFQHFQFPAEFTDIVKLQVPTRLWSMDNFSFETLPSIPLPVDQKLAPAYGTATYFGSRSDSGELLVAGPDYHFLASSGGGRRARYLAGGVPVADFNAYNGTYHPADKILVHNTNDDINPERIRSYNGMGFTDLVTLAQLKLFWPQALALRSCCWSGDRLVLTASGSGNSYAVFEMKNGVLSELLNQGTQVVAPSGSAPYWNSPALLTAEGSSYAFRATLSGRSGAQVLASFNGGPVTRVMGVNDAFSAGPATAIERVEFDPQGRLEVLVKQAIGHTLLRYDANGLIDAELPGPVQPVNTALSVSGTPYRTRDGHVFLMAGGVLYRKHEGRYYRMLGFGDMFQGELLSSVEYLGARYSAPLRIFVEVRFQDAYSSPRMYQLQLDDAPVELAPRIGETLVRTDTGELYMPLSHLTRGREYWLQRSDDLDEWTDLKEVEVMPLQFLRIQPENLGRQSYFRVVER
ncbi:hypothetical protein [Haloferula sp. BvORR071]|uniref:hypothetical protein n=1 Tax=Haloferula sp. BvORR071 TaxID=1396141 RepID=UPI000553E4AE|nr:hypothetical protein [Haloferula sp. BvORR071]